MGPVEGVDGLPVAPAMCAAKKAVVYLVGAMTIYQRLPEPRKWGRDLFALDAWRWAQRGWAIINPLWEDDAEGGPDAVALHMAAEGEGPVILRDLGYVIECNAVAARPDWVQSRVGRLELHLALILGRPIYCAETGRNIAPEVHAAICGHGAEPVPTPAESTTGQSVLQEAEGLINGPRQASYGHPGVDLARTGRMWGAILGIPDVPAEQVALCMVGLKISRQVNKPQRDNLTDGCGYFGVIELIERRKHNGEG
jgi:hypothetical protein